MAHASLCCAFVSLMLVSSVVFAQKIPVIIDTDLGTDMGMKNLLLIFEEY